MEYISTNLRLGKELYYQLKTEAAKKRKSLSAIVRQKLTSEKHLMTRSRVVRLLEELNTLAQKNAKSLRNWDSLEALREIRASQNDSR